MMETPHLEERIVARGKDFLTRIERKKSSIFNRERWVDKMMDWTMSREDLKIEVFTLIDNLPHLTTEQMLYRHIQQSFLRPEVLPGMLRLGVRIAGLLGKPGRKILSGIVRRSVKMVALQFIVGSEVDTTVGKLHELREKDGFAFTLDVLGEETVSEKEVNSYIQSYLRLLAALSEAQRNWKSLGEGNSKLDWGSAPKVNISVKPSALYSRANPDHFEDTVEHMLEQLKRIYRSVVELGAFMCIDAETRRYREVTFELYRRLRIDSEFRGYPHLGLTMQAYFKDSDKELDKLLTWARRETVPISIRLVKGAYWDQEVAVAKEKNVPIPVYTVKAETDMAFERAAEKILNNQDICHLACASHNIRSICSVLELAHSLNVPADRYEFQVLYGAADAFRRTLLEMTGRVRLYCPYGQLLSGIAYLVRRLLENTSNKSFMRLNFDERIDADRLLENPVVTLERMPAR